MRDSPALKQVRTHKNLAKVEAREGGGEREGGAVGWGGDWWGELALAVLALVMAVVRVIVVVVACPSMRNRQGQKKRQALETQTTSLSVCRYGSFRK